MNTHEWLDANGKGYKFTIYPISEISPFKLSPFEKIPGIYIFVKPDVMQKLLGGSPFTSIYIGQTGELKVRVTRSHEKWRCAMNQGMNEVHVCTAEHDPNLACDEIRCQIEKDLKEEHPDLC